MKKPLKGITLLGLCLLIPLITGCFSCSRCTVEPPELPWARWVSITSATAETPYYLAGVDHVYITRTGHCYHTTDHCGTTKVAYELSRAEAFRLGFEPCGLCDPALPLLPDDGFQLPEDEPILYYMVQDGYYHDSDTCSKIKYNEFGTLPVAVTLDEAQYLEKKPCKHCHPAR